MQGILEVRRLFHTYPVLNWQGCVPAALLKAMDRSHLQFIMTDQEEIQMGDIVQPSGGLFTSEFSQITLPVISFAHSTAVSHAVWPVAPFYWGKKKFWRRIVAKIKKIFARISSNVSNVTDWSP